MLIKVVMLFLLAMVAIAMVGKLLFPGAITRSVTRRMPRRMAGRFGMARCGHCGREVVGTRRCVCGKG